MGIFDDLFDFNNDGKLDSFEKAAEFGAFMQVVDSVKNDKMVQKKLTLFGKYATIIKNQ